MCKAKSWNASRALATVSCAFCQLHLRKVLRSLQLFAILKCNRVLATISCAFGRPYLPKCSERDFFTFCRPPVLKVLRLSVFLNISKCKSSSRHSPVHFLRPYVPKVLRRRRLFIWNSNRAATVLCTLCGQLSQLEARNRGNTHPTSATPAAILPEKAQGFASESVSPVSSHASELLHFPTILDDGRLTWWCDWHDGGNANHDNRP